VDPAHRLMLVVSALRRASISWPARRATPPGQGVSHDPARPSRT
jgi:hypothetical protein